MHQGAETVSKTDESKNWVQWWAEQGLDEKVNDKTRLVHKGTETYLDLEAETVSQATDEQIFEGNDEQKGKSDGW